MDKLIVSALALALAAPSIRLADGETDYKAKCASCHGADAKGNAKMAKMFKVDESKLNLTASTLGEKEQLAMTKDGKGKMPKFDGKLSPDQIAAVVKFSMGLAKK